MRSAATSTRIGPAASVDLVGGFVPGGEASEHVIEALSPGAQV